MNGTLPLFPDGQHASNAVAPTDTDEERAKRIVEELSAGLASPAEVFEAFAALDALDSRAVLSALEPWTGGAPSPDALDDELRRRHGFPPRRPRLRRQAVIRDADVLDIGSIAEEQLQIAGKIYDGRDLLAEDRLDGEVEGSFAGTLELHRLFDEDAPAEAPARFDVYMFAGDAGVIFRSGTTEIVGGISYGAVEMKDRTVREAITAALAADVAVARAPRAATSAHLLDESEVVDTTSEKRAPTATKAPVKKASVKKAAVKKAAVKKAAVKKAAVKKAAVKKVAAKKVEAAAPKKAAAKKVEAAAPKKAAAKKAEAAAPKKAAAKKTSTKETPAKRTSAKKTSAKAASPKKVATKKVATTKKATAEKASAKKAAAPKKATAKKVAAKKPTAKKRAAS